MFFSLSFTRIDHKVSSASHGYKLHEAQAILKEVKTIKDAISSGEKEKQELMRVQIFEFSVHSLSNDTLKEV